LSFTEIVIESPPGTIAVRIAVRVGPLEGELDSVIGSDVLAVSGFVVTDAREVYWDPAGQTGGQPAQIAVSEAGIVTLSWTSGAGDSVRPAGTESPILQPHAQVTEHDPGTATTIAEPHPAVTEGDAGVAASIQQPLAEPVLGNAGVASATERPHPEVTEHAPGTQAGVAQATGRDESVALPDAGTSTPVPKRVRSLSRWARDQAARLTRKKTP
jgi:hypothetical protein